MFGIWIGINNQTFITTKITIMKQLFIGLTLLVLVIGKNSYASDPNLPITVKESFDETFGSNTDVTWSETNGLYKAIITIGNKKMIHYYNSNGEVIAIAQYVTSEELGSGLMAELKKQAGNYSILEIYEISNEDGANYYATLDSAKDTIVLKSTGNFWKPFSKTRK